MKRLTLKIVLRGSATARARASRPTIGGPSAGKWITEGIRPLSPSGRRISGRPSFQIAAREFVVPRSMPSAACGGPGWSTFSSR
jgi:hypothetical protein